MKIGERPHYRITKTSSGSATDNNSRRKENMYYRRNEPKDTSKRNTQSSLSRHIDYLA